MTPLTSRALAVVVLAGAAVPAVAQQNPPGLRGDMVAQFDDAATKLVQLAEAIPQDKYAWRPGAGVRSVTEVLLHVAGANYYVLQSAGVQPPMPLKEDVETSMTDKTQVVAFLKQSIDHVRTALRTMSDADLDKATQLFGRPSTYRNVCLTAVSHAHEHLGQLIAYARSNGVVPPWSMARQ